MKNKIVNLFISLLLVGTFFVVAPDRVRAPQDDDYFYTVDGDEAIITVYIGTGKAITIPSTLGGYRTVAIGEEAFNNCLSLTSVTIPNSVTTIGDYAFYYCANLTSVTIPNSVTTIGNNVFQYCTSLTTINVDEANANYASDNGVLYNEAKTTLIQCPAGKAGAVSIPSTVTTIGYNAFYHCASLTTVTIPNSVVTIGKAAFFSCTSLTSIIIPSSVDSIGDYAFYYCTSLTSVTIPNSVIFIGVFAFSYCPLTAVTIGSGVTAIGNFAFFSCTSLASITFLGLVVPYTVGEYWIDGTNRELRGHAYATSNFPAPGGIWNGLTMGPYIPENPPMFSTPSPVNGSTGNLLSLTWSIPINDPEGNTFSWTIQCSNGQSNSLTGASNGTKSLPLSGLAYSTTYKVWVNATDPTGSGVWTRKWYTFTTNQVNNPPMYGTSSPVNGSTGNLLNLTWSIPINDPEENTFSWTIQCNNGQSNSLTGASNGTKSLPLSGLAYSTTYKVWVNATDPTPAGSGRYIHRWFTFTTKANDPPVFGVPSPANGSTGNSLSSSWSIPINDPEGNSFNWRIESNNGQSTYANGVLNGSKSLSLSGLTYSTTYKVWVNATDPTPVGSGLWTCRWYTFTTRVVGNNPPVFLRTPSPANGSTGNLLSLTWNISINDLEGDQFSWTIQCSNGQVSGETEGNGTKLLLLTNLAYFTMYKVWVNVTDPAPPGSGQYIRRWYTFTTKANNPPVFFEPSPANGSTENLQSLTWSIPINDTEGNLFSWTIQCSNGQTKSGIGQTNGTKSLLLSDLTSSRTYKVWVNATDPSGIYTRKWYNFTTKSSDNGGGGGGGGSGNEPPVEPSNKNPIADASAGEPYQGSVNSEITFNGSKSSDTDGNITKWLWVFGDNTNGTEKTVQHIYFKAGTYTVTLTVTDNEGATNTDTTHCMISQINNRPPTKPTINGPINGTKNTMYTYTAVSTDADNDTIQYIFNWGDPKSIPLSSGFLPNGSGYTVDHSWAAAGKYNVIITATDNQSESSFSFPVYIDAVPTREVGYLLDNDGDGIYDAFYSNTSKQITTIQKTDDNYLIDSNGDGDTDYVYTIANGLTSYQTSTKTPGFEIIVFLVTIAVVLFLDKRRRK